MKHRIGDMNTAHILNFTQGPDLVDHADAYLAWMWRACEDSFNTGVHVVKHAKMVLGRQDFCTVGLSYRNWVWVRPFDVVLEDGTVEVWHWRLFVSKQGHSLEIENKHGTFGPPIQRAALIGLAHFIKTWTEASGWEPLP